MKALRTFLTIIALLFFLADVVLLVTGNQHLFKGIRYTYLVGRTGPSIDEYAIFPEREVESGSSIPLLFAGDFAKISVDENLLKEIEQYDPAALLVIHKGKILYEKYYYSYSPESHSNSFSVAKSIVGLSVGACIDRGLIGGINDKVIDYIPELQGAFREELLIRHLLTMTSGINFDESYGDPFGFMAKAYYGDELLKKTLSYEVTERPGDTWQYLGGNTILLSIIVERVSKQNLSEFVSAAFWKPMGAEQPALWSLDEKDGMEKAYCCFYSNARDFARFGMMFLDSGYFDEKRILSPQYIQQCSQAVRLNDGTAIPHYGWHWWRYDDDGHPIVYARGILGQYILVIPHLDAVVVRLGRKRGEKNESNQPVDVELYVKLAHELINVSPFSAP